MNVSVLRREAGHLIRHAKGLLLLIDPLRLPQVAGDRRLHLTPKEATVPPADYREDLSKLASFFDRTPITVPLAICLNKLDRWGPLMEPGTTLHEVATSVPPRGARPGPRPARPRGGPRRDAALGPAPVARAPGDRLPPPPLLRLLGARRRGAGARRRSPTVADALTRRSSLDLASWSSRAWSDPSGRRRSPRGGRPRRRGNHRAGPRASGRSGTGNTRPPGRRAARETADSP